MRIIVPLYGKKKDNSNVKEVGIVVEMQGGDYFREILLYFLNAFVWKYQSI